MRKRCPKEPKHNDFVSPGDNFCYLCGTKLEEYDNECQCGNELCFADRFCSNCGRPQG
jgi:hypothetical protein